MSVNLYLRSLLEIILYNTSLSYRLKSHLATVKILINIAQIRATRTCLLALPAFIEIPFAKSVNFDKMLYKIIVREIRGI